MHLRLRTAIALLLVWTAVAAQPAAAKVRITFWSREEGQMFPHAFFTLDGTPDRGGRPVDISYGFTAKVISPAILFGDVPGKIDITPKSYIMGSFAHFSVWLTDAQYDSVLHLTEEWGEKGDHHYSASKRNCVHFVAEAARRSGLRVVIQPQFVKKPHAFLESVLAMNPQVSRVEASAKVFYGAPRAAAH
jgi:hypothetical protein